MCHKNVVKYLRLLVIVALALILSQATAPAAPARAQEQTPSSDLVVHLVSVPKTAKACDVFQAIYTVTNLGPDTATYISVMVHIPDAYHDIALLGVPYSLAAGETATFSAVIWVGSFVPGEIRNAWVGVTVSSYSDGVNVDPNPENNETRKEMKIVSKPVKNCLPRY